MVPQRLVQKIASIVDSSAHKFASILNPWYIILGTIVAVIGIFQTFLYTSADDEQNVTSTIRIENSYGTANLTYVLESNLSAQLLNSRLKCAIEDFELEVFSETQKFDDIRTSIIWNYKVVGLANDRKVELTGSTNAVAENLEAARISAVARVAKKLYANRIFREECGDAT